MPKYGYSIMHDGGNNHCTSSHMRPPGIVRAHSPTREMKTIRNRLRLGRGGTLGMHSIIGCYSKHTLFALVERELGVAVKAHAPSNNKDTQGRTQLTQF